MRKKAFIFIDSDGQRHVYDFRRDAEIEYLCYEVPERVVDKTKNVRTVFRVYDVVLNDGKRIKCRMSRFGESIVDIDTGDSHYPSEVKNFEDITLAYYLQGGELLYV